MNEINLVFGCGLFIGLIVGFRWGQFYEDDRIRSEVEKFEKRCK